MSGDAGGGFIRCDAWRGFDALEDIVHWVPLPVNGSIEGLWLVLHPAGETPGGEWNCRWLPVHG